jgi:hypothetical protein
MRRLRIYFYKNELLRRNQSINEWLIVELKKIIILIYEQSLKTTKKTRWRVSSHSMNITKIDKQFFIE